MLVQAHRCSCVRARTHTLPPCNLDIVAIAGDSSAFFRHPRSGWPASLQACACIAFQHSTRARGVCRLPVASQSSKLRAQGTATTGYTHLLATCQRNQHSNLPVMLNGLAPLPFPSLGSLAAPGVDASGLPAGQPQTKAICVLACLLTRSPTLPISPCLIPGSFPHIDPLFFWNRPNSLSPYKPHLSPHEFDVDDHGLRPGWSNNNGCSMNGMQGRLLPKLTATTASPYCNSKCAYY